VKRTKCEQDKVLLTPRKGIDGILISLSTMSVVHVLCDLPSRGMSLPSGFFRLAECRRMMMAEIAVRFLLIPKTVYPGAFQN